MNSIVRPYTDSDYEQIAALYKNSNLYGGQFDENRDSEKRLKNKIESDPDSILVAETDGKIVGTVSVIDDGRVAWLFRFCVIDNDETVAKKLADRAIEVLKKHNHHQMLVYTPSGNQALNSRYDKLGFTKGGEYTCYWKDI